MDYATCARKAPKIFNLLLPYRGLLILLISISLLINCINLRIPKLISNGIDNFHDNNLSFRLLVSPFIITILMIFILSYLLGVLQTYTSERVALDLRKKITGKLANQSFKFVQETGISKILTNLTADVESIKVFVSQIVVSLVSSFFFIIAIATVLFTIHWKLATVVISIIPIVAIAFFIVLRKAKDIFTKNRAIIDLISKITNDTILGAAIIRIINAQSGEYGKFLKMNKISRDLGLISVRLFAFLNPIVIFTMNMAALSILLLGGNFVISGNMSLGTFSAFSNYLILLISPILIIGFMGNTIGNASASYQRISHILDAPDLPNTGSRVTTLTGSIKLNSVYLSNNQKPILRNISLFIPAGSKTAIVGPTGSGKTQLLYLLKGLIKADRGEITYSEYFIDDYDAEFFNQQVGYVFQDSVIFSTSIRENIAFNKMVTDDLLHRAIATADLEDFINKLPEKLDTLVSERGSNLSGGQKQRIILARALTLNPSILLLDDFTARVDLHTEQRIVENIHRNYPSQTLISVTQKIASVVHYDQVILLMNGGIVAVGKHEELMRTCLDYAQIVQSQQSICNYEL
ncbi:ABC transporter ATP-binding protein [Sphingobacterium faecium]|uniref:ABC transporter ATP-binding protein n=1 Tax=Sphingobacterium faecium TaxID=34087 RepID=UPI00320A2B44